MEVAGEPLRVALHGDRAIRDGLGVEEQREHAAEVRDGMRNASLGGAFRQTGGQSLGELGESRVRVGLFESR